MRLLTLEITEALAGRTVKNLLKRELCLSASLISHLKYRSAGITVNGSQVRTTHKVSAGDILSVNIDDDIAAGSSIDSALKEYIYYEDDDLLIFDKPAGMEMHPKHELPNDRSVKTLVCSYLGSGAVFHPVNRLDAGTSGLMTAAKNRYMCDRLRRLLHTDQFVREYVAIVCGVPRLQSGTIDLPLDGQDSKTDYTVLLKNDAYAIVHLRLHTGRTHQIRKHLSMLGYPLYGDVRYGGAADAALARPALHSAHIQLIHPLSKKSISLSCPLPQDLRSVAERLFGANLLSLSENTQLTHSCLYSIL